jgi:hypothetical protein
MKQGGYLSCTLTISKNILVRFEALRVLKLTVCLYSLNVTDTPTQMLCMPPVLRTVQRAEDKIFGWKFPKLAALVFVIEGQKGPWMTEKTFAFLRSKKLSPTGEEVPIGLPVEPPLVKHHVPCADILEDEKFVFA